MIRRFSQMSKEEWPKGLTMAVAKLCLEPDQLTSQFGIQFFEDRDDLDGFRAALVRVDESHEYAFVRYLGSPDPGTEVAGLDPRGLLGRHTTAATVMGHAFRVR